MTKIIPKWLFTPYSKIWKKYGTKQFTFEQAKVVLKITEQRTLSDIFSSLRKSGWLEDRRDDKSKRNKVFWLREPNAVMRELLDEYSK